MTEIEKNLKKMADEIPVPEKLSPDQIEKKLKNNRKKPHRYVRGVCVAAAAVIVVGAGVMMWQNQKMSPQKQQTTAEQYQNTTPPQDTVEEHKTYEEIRKSIDDYLTEKEEITVLDGDMAYSSATEAYSSATEDTSQTKTSGNSVNDYTKTNIQVEGIDEADMVKTDGKYIYSYYRDAVSSTISIVKAEGKDSAQIGKIVLADVQVQALYVQDRWLVVLAEDENTSSDDANVQTRIYLYDVSNPEKPICRSKNSQSGYYSDSRLTGSILYTISVKRVYEAEKKTDKKEYIPEVGGEILPEDSLYCPNPGMSAEYLVFQSIDLSQSGKTIDSMAVLGAEGTYYMSEKNIYVATETDAWRKTKISRYSYEKGTIKYACEKVINGTILNQFSMDEYEGNLRFAATTYDDNGKTTNGLYIVDSSFKTIGSVSRLAPGERIYSARFMGESVYFVTYRETDPLFLVDVSDPANPVVKDKLKIPGFSDYLHPFGENMLLGIGSIQDKEGNSYVKLSMFDISNPEKVKEIHSKKLGKNTVQNMGSDHKGIVVDAERNRIAFGVENYDDTTDSFYEIFSYDKQKGFQNIAKLSLEESYSTESRGLYIGDYFYLCKTSSGICVYDTKKYKKIRSIAY